MTEWPEKWRFVCGWVLITIGIYETHQAFSQEDAAFEGDSGIADTVKQGFQTSCLLSPSLLNHHHSSQLYDRSHDISPVRAAAYAPPPPPPPPPPAAADSDNESGSEPQPFDASVSRY